MCLFKFAACHNSSRWRPAKMDHGVVTADCASCHRPPAAHYPGGCRQCHSTTAWKLAAGAHNVPLDGAHPGLSCNSCHSGGRYTGLGWDCASCHRSAHATGYSSSCSACHNQSGWRPASLNHNALTGDCSLCHQPPEKHASGACRQCHPTGGSWKSTFTHARVEKHSYKSFPCDNCHSSADESYDCRRCHDSNSPGD